MLQISSQLILFLFARLLVALLYYVDLSCRFIQVNGNQLLYLFSLVNVFVIKIYFHRHFMVWPRYIDSMNNIHFHGHLAYNKWFQEPSLTESHLTLLFIQFTTFLRNTQKLECVACLGLSSCNLLLIEWCS